MMLIYSITASTHTLGQERVFLIIRAQHQQQQQQQQHTRGVSTSQKYK